MDTKQLSLIDEAINLEINVGRLYVLFSEQFPEDNLFWQQLAHEEIDHSLLLRSEKEFFLKSAFIPPEIVSVDSTNQLIQTNQKIEQCIEKFQKKAPERAYAFSLACHIENFAGEYHLQQSMKVPSYSKVLELFKTLNSNDQDHSAHISSYMAQHGIEQVAVTFS